MTVVVHMPLILGEYVGWGVYNYVKGKVGKKNYSAKLIDFLFCRPAKSGNSQRTLRTFASPTSQRSKPKLAKELQFCLRTRAKLLLLKIKN